MILKGGLIVINNELVNSDIEVEVANYLCLCGVSYKYDYKEN